MKSHELARVLLNLENRDIKIGHMEIVIYSEATESEEEVEREIAAIKEYGSDLVITGDNYYCGKTLVDFTKDES